MISVVIPAHNESAVIGFCLSALLSDVPAGTFEVVVVCNGCLDETASIARSFGPDVSVVELAEASKSAALNAGEAAISAFPRVYLDADLVVTGQTVLRLIATLPADWPAVASPFRQVDLSHASWAIRAYYRIQLLLPFYAGAGAVGGCYALTESGRARFGAFPSIIADDLFVRNHFEQSERIVLGDASFVVVPPSSLASLTRVKSRALLGQAQYRRQFPGLAKATSADAELRKRPYGLVLRQPRLWVDAVVFAAVSLNARLLVSRQLRRGDFRWRRDETGRSGTRR